MRTTGGIVPLFLILSSSLLAQVNVDAGAIAGTVTDPNNQPVSKASVTLSGRIQRAAVTAADGSYRFPLVPPGLYQVRAESPGFSRKVQEGVTVVVGETTTLDIALDAGASTFSVTVSAKTPAVDFQRSQQAGVIGLERIENLPVNQRNYLDFAMLTPGVVGTATIADAADFRLVVAPGSGLGFSGSNGRGNNVFVDGISINGPTADVRPSIPQAGVEEFQVNRNSYAAEFGGAYGGTVNIVSRAGGKDFHGELFGLLRHRSIQARNYFDPEKSAFTREQSGIALSGPLGGHRTFFYGAYERLDRHETVFVPLLVDPNVLTHLTPGQAQLVSFLQNSGVPALAQIGAGLQAALTPSNNPMVPAIFKANSGTFPFGAASNQGSLRLDRRLTEKNDLFFRGNFTRADEANTTFGALHGVSNGNSNTRADETFVLGDTHVFSPQWLSVSRISFAATRVLIEPNDPLGPETVINGYGTFGRNYLYPFDENEKYGEAQQTFQRTSPNHALKFGVDVSAVRDSSGVQTFFGGRFLFGNDVPLGGLLEAQSPGLATFLAQILTAAGQPSLAGVLGQPLTALQTYSLGLPDAYVEGFGSPVYQRWRTNEGAFVEDSWRVHRKLTLNIGLRQDFEAPPDLSTRTTFSPRFGFAWNPTKGDTVIRGGYGIFRSPMAQGIAFVQHEFNRPDVTLLVVPLTGLPGTINPQTNLPVTSADVYQTLLAEGVLGRRAIRITDLLPLGIRPGFTSPLGGAVQGDYTSPYSQQASLAAEHGFGGLAVGISLETSRTQHVWRTRDQNLIQTGTRPDGWPIFGQRNPAYYNYNVYESSGNAWYSAMVLHASKRMSRHWLLDSHFTWSKAINDVTDINIEYAAHNQLDNRAERGLSLFHQKYRLVGSGVFDWKGWKFAPIVSANSFRPFNVLTGADNLGDGQEVTHRPLGLGRDVGIGPNYFSIDTRLARVFRLTEHVRAELALECFNLLNRTNFQSVNNIVGDIPLSALPTLITGQRTAPTTPLAYTSAYAPRQFQIGLKFAF